MTVCPVCGMRYVLDDVVCDCTKHKEQCQHCGCTCFACEGPGSVCRTKVMTDTLRRAQARGTELLERARAAKVDRDHYKALFSASDGNHEAAIKRYGWAESEMARAAEVARSVADGMRASIFSRSDAERVLRKLAGDLEGKR